MDWDKASVAVQANKDGAGDMVDGVDCGTWGCWWPPQWRDEQRHRGRKYRRMWPFGSGQEQGAQGPGKLERVQVPATGGAHGEGGRGLSGQAMEGNFCRRTWKQGGLVWVTGSQMLLLVCLSLWEAVCHPGPES